MRNFNVSITRIRKSGGHNNHFSLGSTQEWAAILIERFENAKLNQIKEVVEASEAAKNGIDAFRVANSLEPKFPKSAVNVPVEEVKAEPVAKEEVTLDESPSNIQVEEATIRG